VSLGARGLLSAQKVRSHKIDSHLRGGSCVKLKYDALQEENRHVMRIADAEDIELLYFAICALWTAPVP
jgi:hypothetical protein